MLTDAAAFRSDSRIGADVRTIGDGDAVVQGSVATPAPIRVALVAPTLTILGGHSVQADRLLDGWRQDPAVDLRLVPINPVPLLPTARISRVKYARTAMTQARYWPLLVRELRRADVVHVFATSNSSFFVSAMPALLVARACGKPVILNHHGDDPHHLLRMAGRWGLLTTAARHVAPSSYFAQALRRAGLHTDVIPNVADLERFRYRVRDPLRPRLLSTRNFEPIYNVAATLRAFQRVRARYPASSLTVVGYGSEDAALRALCRERDLRGVTFAGPVAQNEIHRYYDAADIYVQSPRMDNMPCSIQEAFASGTPVVATNVGGVPLMLEHGVNGLLAPSDDDTLLAEQIVRLLEQPDAARQMAAAALLRTTAYRWSVVREQWLNAYRSAMTDGAHTDSVAGAARASRDT